MKTTNSLSSCRPCCSTAGILLGIIAGIIVAILFSLGLTPLILNGIWVAFSIGAASLVYVAVLAAVGGCSALRGSLIKNLRCLLAGIFGTILTSIVLVSVALEISSIIISILVGILTFFLIFLIASLISFLKSLVY